MIIKSFCYLYSIINLFLLNIFIFSKKIFYKKKIIFFYHPKENLTKMHTFYIEDFLLKFEKNNVFFGGKILLFKYFYIKESLLSYIYNVDIFVSNFLCDNFTHNSKRVYFHHDIYDTPLVEKKKEKEITKRLSKYDFVLLASTKSKFIFEKTFFKVKKKPKILYLGFYPKLNYLLKKKNVRKKIQNNIIIAPTDFYAFPKLTMQPYLENLISHLIKNNYTITYRPHPSNAKEKKVLTLAKKFRNTKNFILDTTSNYFNSYSSSSLMITDISGTAYTYAFLTKNPVFFYSPNEKIIKKTYYNNLSYFKDRHKIGKVFLNTELIIAFFKRNKNNKFKKAFKINILDIYKKYFDKLDYNVFKKMHD